MSALEKQLRQLALARGQTLGKAPKGKPSLLFAPQEASDLDLQSIYEIGQSGEIMTALASKYLDGIRGP